MLTVPQVAERLGRNPETIRRWIRAGRLRSSKVGTQHVINEQDVEALVEQRTANQLPSAWRQSPSGAPAPDWVELLHEARRGR